MTSVPSSTATFGVCVSLFGVFWASLYRGSHFPAIVSCDQYSDLQMQSLNPSIIPSDYRDLAVFGVTNFAG